MIDEKSFVNGIKDFWNKYSSVVFLASIILIILFAVVYFTSKSLNKKQEDLSYMFYELNQIAEIVNKGRLELGMYALYNQKESLDFKGDNEQKKQNIEQAKKNMIAAQKMFDDKKKEFMSTISNLNDVANNTSYQGIALLYLAAEQVNDNKLEEALKNLELIYNNAKYDPLLRKVASTRIIIIKIMKGEYETALSMIDEDLIKFGGGEVLYKLLKADIYRIKGNFIEARKLLKELKENINQQSVGFIDNYLVNLEDNQAAYKLKEKEFLVQ